MTGSMPIPGAAKSLCKIVGAHYANVSFLRDYVSMRIGKIKYNASFPSYPLAGAIDRWQITEELMDVSLEIVDGIFGAEAPYEKMEKKGKALARKWTAIGVVLASMINLRYGVDFKGFHDFGNGIFKFNPTCSNLRVGDAVTLVTKIRGSGEGGLFHLEGYAKDGAGVKIAVISDMVKMKNY